MSIVYAEFIVDVKQKKIDENGQELYPFKITQNNIDAVGDIVHQKGIIQDRYLENNIILYMHDYFRSIGKSFLEMTDNGIIAWGWFDEITELSRESKKQVDAGTLKAASIGLRVIESNDRTPTPEEKSYLQNMPYIKKVTDITKSELIEWSVVTIPMNPKTLIQRATEKGFDLIDIEMLKKSFGINEMENTKIEKAGAKISAVNKNKLQTILDNAQSTMDLCDEMMSDPMTDEPMAGEPMDGEMKSLTDSINEKDLTINDLEMRISNMKSELKIYKDNDYISKFLTEVK